MLRSRCVRVTAGRRLAVLAGSSMGLNASEVFISTLLDTLAADAADRVRDGEPSFAVMRRLIDALPVAALVAGDDGRYIITNSLASALTGYSAEELRQLSVWDLTPAINEHEVDTLWRAFRQQRAQSGDYPLLRKDGRVVTATYAARVSVLPGLHVSLLQI
jgi:PAS domain S-box-containing protein